MNPIVIYVLASPGIDGEQIPVRSKRWKHHLERTGICSLKIPGGASKTKSTIKVGFSLDIGAKEKTHQRKTTAKVPGRRHTCSSGLPLSLGCTSKNEQFQPEYWKAHNLRSTALYATITDKNPEVTWMKMRFAALAEFTIWPRITFIYWQGGTHESQCVTAILNKQITVMMSACTWF